MFKIEYNFVKNKLARRFLALFVIVVLIPITGTILVSYQHVSNQLQAQSYEQLRQTSKALGLEFHRRLTVIKHQMQEVRKIVLSQEGMDRAFSLISNDSLFPDISGLARVTNSGNQINIGSGPDFVPILAQSDMAAFHSDRAAFVADQGADGQQHYFLILRMDPEDPESDLLVGQVSPEYLFSVDQLVSDSARLIVLDASGDLYYSSLSETELNEIRDRFNVVQDSAISGSFSWGTSGQAFLASYYSVFADAEMTTPYFSIIINRSEQDSLAPITRYRNTFVPGLLLVMLLITLAAVGQISKRLAPLTVLRDATKRIASGDFDTRVAVNSDDEIGQLQSSFNSMAEGLDRFLRARDSAQAASKAKSEFLSSMSHELRTPLNAIIGLSELLDIDQADKSIDEQSKYPKEIMNAGYHLLDLIDDVLDLSRIEAGNLKLEIEPVSISSVTSECVKQIEIGLAIKQGVTIDDRTAEKGLWVSADKRRLTQIFFNLLSNAVKYNREKGTVVIDSHKRSDDWVRVTVIDSGYGIAALKILRASPETRDIPVVTLSANAMESDLQSGRDVGFDSYLTKPIDLSKLLIEISRFLNKPVEVASCVK